MMRAEVIPVHTRTSLREPGVDGRVHHVQERLVDNASANATLVGDDHGNVACAVEQADRVAGVGIHLQQREPIEISPLLDDGAVAVQEDGGPEVRHGPARPARHAARYRQQALQWLQEELPLVERDLMDPIQRAGAAELIGRLLHEADFQSVRTPDERAKLPDPEQSPWQQLWLQIDALGRSAGIQPLSQ